MLGGSRPRNPAPPSCSLDPTTYSYIYPICQNSTSEIDFLRDPLPNCCTLHIPPSPVEASGVQTTRDLCIAITAAETPPRIPSHLSGFAVDALCSSSRSNTCANCCKNLRINSDNHASVADIASSSQATPPFKNFHSLSM